MSDNNKQSDDGYVVIVSNSKGFFINGVEKKLLEAGIRAKFVGTNIWEIDQLKKQTKIYVLYISEENRIISDCLSYLKNNVSGTDKKVVVIGEKSDRDMVGRMVTHENIVNWFARPLNMDEFIDYIQNFKEEKNNNIEKKTVLIVDDDITYMRMVYDWLKDDYRVGMASNGVQAIGWLAKNHVDLILLDYDMPVASGPQILEMLKNNADTGKVPVMFLTGKNDSESILSVIELCPADYLLKKTMDKDLLLEKLKKFFKL